MQNYCPSSENEEGEKVQVETGDKCRERAWKWSQEENDMRDCRREVLVKNTIEVLKRSCITEQN